MKFSKGGGRLVADGENENKHRKSMICNKQRILYNSAVKRINLPSRVLRNKICIGWERKALTPSGSNVDAIQRKN